jgi:hypothetical protein
MRNSPEIRIDLPAFFRGNRKLKSLYVSHAARIIVVQVMARNNNGTTTRSAQKQRSARQVTNSLVASQQVLSVSGGCTSVTHRIQLTDTFISTAGPKNPTGLTANMSRQGLFADFT